MRYNITHIIRLNFLVGRVGQIIGKRAIPQTRTWKVGRPTTSCKWKTMSLHSNRCKTYASHGERLSKFISSEGNSSRKCAACWKNEILRNSVSYPVWKNRTLKGPTESLTSFVHFSCLWILQLCCNFEIFCNHKNASHRRFALISLQNL